MAGLETRLLELESKYFGPGPDRALTASVRGKSPSEGWAGNPNSPKPLLLEFSLDAIGLMHYVGASHAFFDQPSNILTALKKAKRS